MTNTNTSIQNSCCSQPTAVQERNEWSYTPAIDLYEVDDAYVIECDVPGLNKDRIDLIFDHGMLRMHGEVTSRHPEAVSFLSQEYGVGDFDREIALGRLAEVVDADRVDAEYADGVLTIRLPKLEVAQPRRISVKSVNA